MKKLEEVFKRSGIPTYTFVEPVEYRRLFVSLRTKGRGLVIEGPSGIGKTTCVLKALNDIGIREQTLVLSARNENDVDLIASLPTMDNIGTVIIDDFHRLDDSLKYSVADFIKTLADKEITDSKVVIVGINKVGSSLIFFAHDLTGRVDTIPFEANPIDRIFQLIIKGEEALNIKINIRDDIVKEAQGSFHITQMLCHETCLDAGILEEQIKLTAVNSSMELIREKVLNEISGNFRPLAKKFATGPRLRPEGRAPYFHLLYWLATNNEWSLQIDEALSIHPEHKGSVGQIVEKGYLNDHLEKNPDLSNVIHFDHQTKVLTVEDPKFVYFIRNILWSKFSKELGYKTLEFKSKYDFALSFAGADRDIAQALFDFLSNAEMNVFYDKNEQHRILAANVEDYLGPIYRSEAQFVIALLGPEYPKRIWTKFESEQFRDRFGDNSVIPIWFNTAPPGLFDETTRLGGLHFDRRKDLNDQVNEMGRIICKKMEEERMK
jgi:hypothetical protein